jgi:hypothetical protein
LSPATVDRRQTVDDYHSAMKSLDQIRRERLEQLIREDFKGRAQSLADKVGKDRRQVSAWRRYKGMADETAREIEAAALKPSGWLDHEDEPTQKGETQQRQQSHSLQPDPQILAEAMKWVVFEEGPLVKKPDGSLEPKYPYEALERMQRLSEIYALAVADGGTLSPITAKRLIDAVEEQHKPGDVDSERREVASGRRAAK